MIFLKTIENEIENELIIKNSKFITYLYPLKDNNINNYLDKIKKIHSKATHYCYAYIYNDIKHSSDDNEPSNTAGLPMLNVLEKNDLNNILAIVVRYFGGIKLGAGGLVRAYTKSVSDALKSANIIELVKGYKIKLEFDYQEEKQINYILKASEILNKEYKDNIEYIVNVDEDTLSKLKNYQILENILITKK